LRGHDGFACAAFGADRVFSQAKALLIPAIRTKIRRPYPRRRLAEAHRSLRTPVPDSEAFR
jgi:hypothetical protein